MRRLTATLLTAALTLPGAPLLAQDIGSARAVYSDISGTWAEPGLDCSQSIDTWVFTGDAVLAGQTRLDLLGIGGGGGAVRLDLVSRTSGMRVPLALNQFGDTLQVRGSGISADLRRCGTTQPSQTITAQPLDPQSTPEDDLGPTTDELRAALGEPSTQEGATGSESARTIETAVEEEVGAAAERRYETELAGGWRGGDGTCSWQLGGSSISVEGTSYDVVSFSGSPDRIGVQALDPDGTPATFTIVPDGAGSASVTGARPDESNISTSLSRC